MATTKDELITQLQSSDELTSIFDQFHIVVAENSSLKSQLKQKEYDNYELESKLALQSSQNELFELSLQQKTNEIETNLTTIYQTQIDSLQEQLLLLQNELDMKNNKITKLEQVIIGQKTNMEKIKTAYLGRSLQLYDQLLKYQKQDSIKLVKSQFESNSRAYLTVDKLGSKYHLDTIQSNQLQQSTSTNNNTIGSTKIKDDYNNKSINTSKDKDNNNNERFKFDTNEVLCTRDQIRLSISGQLYDSKCIGDIRWYRSQNGSAFVQIPNAGGRARADASIDETYGVSMTYIPTVDDLYCTIRCQFVDPSTGATLSAEIGPCVPDKELLESAVEGYKKNELEMNVTISDSDLDLMLEKEKEYEKLSKLNKEHDKQSRTSFAGQNGNNGSTTATKPNFLDTLGMGGGGGVMSDYKLTLSTKKIIISGKKQGKKIQCKITMDSTVYIAAHSDTEIGFSIYLYGNWINCNAPNRHQRDIILALTRLFIQQTRINDFSTESERHREKQYSSAWLLLLINAEHDVLTSMPKSKIQQSLSLSIIQDELNVGDILLQPKLSSCQYHDNDVFIDVVQTTFDTVMDVLPEELLINNNIDDDDNNNNNNDDTTTESNNNEEKDTSVNPSLTLSTTDNATTTTRTTTTTTTDDKTKNNNNTSQDSQTPTCLWVTRQEFEQNALLHAQIATLDYDPKRKPHFFGQRQRPHTALSNSVTRGGSFSLSSQVYSNNQQPSSPRTNQQNNNNTLTTNPSTTTTTTGTTMKHTADEEYVPYDIDDVTPQLGQGKRGFDDIVIGGDSDDDENGITNGTKTNNRRGSVLGNGMTQEEHYGAPAFEVKIKNADEVQIDTTANTAKIKQIFDKNPLLSLEEQNGVNPSISTTMTGGRGRRQIKTASSNTTLNTPSHAGSVNNISTPSHATSGNIHTNESREPSLQRPPQQQQSSTSTPTKDETTTTTTTTNERPQSSAPMDSLIDDSE